MYLALDYILVKRCSVDNFSLCCYDLISLRPVIMFFCGSLYPYICLVFKPYEKCFTFSPGCFDIIQFELSQ